MAGHEPPPYNPTIILRINFVWSSINPARQQNIIIPNFQVGPNPDLQTFDYALNCRADHKPLPMTNPHHDQLVGRVTNPPYKQKYTNNYSLVGPGPNPVIRANHITPLFILGNKFFPGLILNLSLARVPHHLVCLKIVERDTKKNPKTHHYKTFCTTAPNLHYQPQPSSMNQFQLKYQ